MEKYGVVHELSCECGDHKLVSDKGADITEVPTKKLMDKASHVHEWKELPDGTEAVR